MGTSIVANNIYHGPATIIFQDGHTESYEVCLWNVERIKERSAIGHQQLPSRNDVLRVKGEIVTSLHLSKLMELASAKQLHLRYGEHSWEISFDGSPRFSAWGHSVNKQ
jgi:hypothetical protein